MRVQESFVDYNHVHPEHEAIHARLENWRRWVTVRPHGWQTAPMFRLYQSKARQWHAPVIQNHVDTLDALKIERAVSRLPTKNREAIRWCYVFAGNPLGMARRLAVSRAGLLELIEDGRRMVANLIRENT